MFLGLPILSKFTIRYIQLSILALSWETKCAPESVDTTYIITYSTKNFASVSELNQSESQEESRIEVRSSPIRLRMLFEYEYHMTVAIKYKTQIGPPSEKLTFFYTDELPEFTIKVENISSNEVTLSFHPINISTYIIETYVHYWIRGLRELFKTKEKSAKIKELTSNHFYRISVELCWTMVNTIKCRENLEFINVTTDVDPPGTVYVYKDFTASAVLEWDSPIKKVSTQNDKLEIEDITNNSKERSLEVEIDILNYYEVKLQTSDRGDTVVQITGTKCTLVPTVCNIGTNIYSIRAVVIQTGSQRKLQSRPANYVPVLCEEERSSVEPTKDREHVPGAWLQVRKDDCPQSTSITTIIIYVVLGLSSALPIGVFMASRKYKKMLDIGVELPYGLEIDFNAIADRDINRGNKETTTNEDISLNVNPVTLFFKSRSIFYLFFRIQASNVSFEMETSFSSSMPDVATNDCPAFKTPDTLANPTTSKQAIAIELVSTLYLRPGFIQNTKNYIVKEYKLL